MGSGEGGRLGFLGEENMGGSRRVSRGYLVVGLFALIFAWRLHRNRAIALPRNWNDKQWQRVQSQGLGEKYSFAVLGDNKNSAETFGELIQALNEDDIAFAIDLGDLVETGTEERYAFFLRQLHQLKKPFFTAIGNHELEGRGRGLYYEIFGPFYYAFEVGDAYFIVLDDANGEDIDPWQMSWLEEQLKRSLKDRYRFVFMHVPLYAPWEDEKQDGWLDWAWVQEMNGLKNKEVARRLNALFDQYRVTMVFCSHVHAYYKGWWGHTPFIITGGAGSELTGVKPAHDFYHYVKVVLSEEGVRYEVHKLPTPSVDIGDRLLHDFWVFLFAFLNTQLEEVLLGLGGVSLLWTILTTRGFFPLATSGCPEQEHSPYPTENAQSRKS